MNYKTPGVYIEEVSLLPPSVAQVETAIPGFVGYTEKAIGHKGKSLQGKAVRIKSMAEYRQYFGGPVAQPFTVKLGDSVPFSVESVSLPTTVKPYRLYQSLEIYFANGGGPCYIVSVGDYDILSDPPSLDNVDDYDELKSGLDALRKVDEVTLLVVPEADRLAQADYHTLCQDMLVQAGDLQDRFAVLDVRSDNGETVSDFRNGIGTSFLNYGAAYYPYLRTTLPYHSTSTSIAFEQAEASNLANGLSLQQLEDLATISDEKLLVDALVTKGKAALLAPKRTAYEAIVAKAEMIVSRTTRLVDNADEEAQEISLASLAGDVAAAIAEDPTTKANIDNCLDALQAAVDDLNSLAGDAIKTILTVSDANAVDLDVLKSLYTNQFVQSIKQMVAKPRQTLPPSAAMVGLYAMVDNTRGVWKAPANVSVRYVTAPAINISHDDQRDLNVHHTGKSINAIRAFSGRGTLVWGARTLAGNDNEWRYVPVRRFYNMVEESVKKASEAFVFEPNSANTWTKVKAMIENYLTILWRQGAMMGTTIDEAFFVKIGLGETMTEQDVLEGRMIVEIGMAAVRPAEFIILRFSHFMQEN